MSSLPAAASVCLLMALSFAGCLWFDGHCGPFYEDATWREAGLFVAVGEMGTASRLGPEGFDFEHENVTARWGGDVTVRHVSWANESAHGGGEHATRLSLAAGGVATRGAAAPGPHVSMSADARVPNETWASMLVTFLEATGTTPEDRDTWIAGFLADRTVMGYSYGADRVERPILSSAREVEAVPDLTTLAQALGTPALASGSTRHAEMSWETPNGTWRFHLHLPTYSFELGELRDETVAVTVDSADAVTASMPQTMGDHLDDYRDWVATRFQEEGLPRPTFAEFDVAVAIC